MHYLVALLEKKKRVQIVNLKGNRADEIKTSSTLYIASAIPGPEKL